jgi:hypothetical protein
LRVAPATSSVKRRFVTFEVRGPVQPADASMPTRTDDAATVGELMG